MKVKTFFCKVLYLMLIAIMILSWSACNKSETSNSNITMSATVNSSNINFSTTLSNSNGYTVVTGSGTYSITIVLKTLAAGTYVLADQSTGYYATVTDNFGNSYSTDIANTGQIVLTASGIRFNGTFYFIANETSPVKGGGNVNVSNGSCTNI